MRTRSSLPLSFILPWLFLACSESGTLSIIVPVHQPIDTTLRQGERVLLNPDEILLEFTRTEEDSRCPEEGFCKWEGRATIELRLNPDHPSPAVFSLIIPGMVQTPHESAPFDTLGYRWTLRQLNPYPRSSPPPKPIVYEALLRIQKME